ncbi:MAG TPA: RNA ligase family protein [Blastocatellia bacterium]|nr:RNA ligase family protein [Blastocatellia bacterium]
MKEYTKIQTIFKRDEKNRIVEGCYTLPEFEYLKDNVWVFTEKVDGTNTRVMWQSADRSLKFGGKTDQASIPVSLLYRLQELFTESRLVEVFPETDGCLYGEGYGKKIQSAGVNYIPDGVDFVLFDVKIGEWWLQREDIVDVANKLGIRVVPIVGEGTLSDAVKMVKQGFNSVWGNFIAEGIVARPKVELKTRKSERIITKIKYRDFH